MTSQRSNQLDSFSSEHMFHDCRDIDDDNNNKDKYNMETNMAVESNQTPSIFSPVDIKNISGKIDVKENINKKDLNSLLRISISSPPLLPISETQNTKKLEVSKIQVTPDLPYISFPTSDSREFFIEEHLDIGIDMQCYDGSNMVLDNLIRVNSKDTQSLSTLEGSEIRPADKSSQSDVPNIHKKNGGLNDAFRNLASQTHKLGAGITSESTAEGSLVKLHIAPEHLHENFPRVDPSEDAKSDQTEKSFGSKLLAHPSPFVQINLIHSTYANSKSEKEKAGRVIKDGTSEKKSPGNLRESQFPAPEIAEKTSNLKGEEKPRAPKSRKSIGSKNRKSLAVTSSNRKDRFPESEVDTLMGLTKEQNSTSDQSKVISEKSTVTRELRGETSLSTKRISQTFRNRKSSAVASSNKENQFPDEVDSPVMSAHEQNSISDPTKITPEQSTASREEQPLTKDLINTERESFILQDLLEMSAVFVSEESFISDLENYSSSSPKKLPSIESVIKKSKKKSQNYEDGISRMTKSKSDDCKTTNNPVLQPSRKIKFPVTLSDNSKKSINSRQSLVESSPPQDATNCSEKSKDKNKKSVKQSTVKVVTFNSFLDCAPLYTSAKVLKNVNNENPFYLQNNEGTDMKKALKKKYPTLKSNSNPENETSKADNNYIVKRNKPRCRIRPQRRPSTMLKPINSLQDQGNCQ